MILGAYIMSFYIDLAYAKQIGDGLRDDRLGMLLVFWLTYFLASQLRKRSGAKPKYRDVSPRRAGTIVVLLTGGFAAASAGWNDIGDRFIWASLIALFTLISAAVVWRFASDHAGEIGEARFTTSPKPE